MKKHYLLFCSIAVIAAQCPTDPDIVIDHSSLKIVLSDSLDVVKNDDILNVPKSIRELSDVIVSEEKKCSQTFVLDPSLIRLDQPKEFSLKTTITKGGAKDVSNPKVVGKLIGKHLDELDVPESFIKASGTSFRKATQVATWLASQVPNDSVVVYSPDGPTKYSLGKRTYPTFSDIEGIREYIRNALCQNAKANFTLLYNPPSGTIQFPPPPPEKPHVGHGGTHEGYRPPIPPKPTRRPVVRMDGICDPVTHHLYEQILDENGRPQRGKILVMNCKECGYTGNN